MNGVQLLVSLWFLLASLAAPSFLFAATAPTVPIETQTFELEIQLPDGTKDTLKLELQHARPKTMAELAAAEEWLIQSERQTPSQFRMVVDKFKSKLHEHVQKISGIGQVHHIQIDPEIVASISNDLKKEKPSWWKPSNWSQWLSPKKWGRAVDNHLERYARNWTTEEHTRLTYKFLGKEQQVTDYDLQLGFYRLTGNAVFYTGALWTTMPFEHAAPIALVMGALSGKVQVFVNALGDWLGRQGRTYRAAEPVAKAMTQMAAMASSASGIGQPEKIRESKHWLANKVNYYAKYAVFEGVFVSVFYSLLMHYGQDPGEAVWLYLLTKVPQAMAAQGLLEEYFLRKRDENREHMPKIRADVKYSKSVFVVSLFNNSAVALASLPGMKWVGNATLTAMAGTGLTLFFRERLVQSCENLLNSAFPPPQLIPGLHYNPADLN